MCVIDVDFDVVYMQLNHAVDIVDSVDDIDF